MHTLKVTTKGGVYPLELVESTSAILHALEKDWVGQGRIAAVMDEQVARCHPEFFRGVEKLGPVLRLAGGEGTKEVGTLAKVWDFCAASQLDRGSILLVCGGGVVGDCGGFAAATWLRGIRFIQIPTTLLAMVDSSVGGKTGINTTAGKNLVGAFHQPSAVYLSRAFLDTLPEEEINAGMAEVIKAGMLGDEALFADLEKLGRPLAADPGIDAVIRRACQIKAEVVSADEKESAREGGRALLNLGHTFAHAIENVAGYGRYLHGEAVAIGLSMATAYSIRTGRLGEEQQMVVDELLRRFQLPIRLREALPLEDLLTAMGKDKKNRDGQLRLVLLNRIGEAVTVGGVEVGGLQDLWRHYGAVDRWTGEPVK